MRTRKLKPRARPEVFQYPSDFRSNPERMRVALEAHFIVARYSLNKTQIQEELTSREFIIPLARMMGRLFMKSNTEKQPHGICHAT